MNPSKPDYSFISQGANSPVRSFAPKTTKQRIMMVGFVAGAIILLIIIISVVMGMFTVDNSKKLTDLAISQNEIQRIMDLGVASASSSSVKANAQTASSTFASQKQRTIAVAAKKGVKISDKQLAAAKKTTTIDKKLDAAKSANSFDDTFNTVYEEQITAYYASLKTLIGSEGDKTIKAALVDYANNTAVLSLNYKPKTTAN